MEVDQQVAPAALRELQLQLQDAQTLSVSSRDVWFCTQTSVYLCNINMMVITLCIQLKLEYCQRITIKQKVRIN